MTKEDYKYLPLVPLAVGMYVGESVIKPLLVNGAKFAGRTALNLLEMAMPAEPPPHAVQAASITFYSTGGENERNRNTR